MKAVRIRMIGMLAAAALLLLSGCATVGLRTETIVIPDSEEAEVRDGGEAFEANTIYRLPDMNEKYAGEFRWAGAEELIRLYWDNRGRQAVESYVPPYEKPLRQLDLEPYILDYSGLSPNGQYFASFKYGDEADVSTGLSLLKLQGGEQKTVDARRTFLQRGARTLTWSNNSRYVSYFSVSGQGEIEISVYNRESEEIKSYAMPDQNETIFYYSVKLSDDGSGALIVKEEQGKPASFVLGRWEDDRFIGEYEHTLHESYQVDWIDADRIAFVGTDGTLFAYDRRNGGIAVLLDQVGGFALSPDRQYIAYLTDEVGVDVATLQGNNLLNKKTVYRGLVASQMTWSSDNGALLIQGRKPYEGPLFPKSAPALKVEEMYNDQLFVIDFK